MASFTQNLGDLQPLAVFCGQPQSHQFIGTVKNLGDIWRQLEERPLNIDSSSVAIVTKFGLQIELKNVFDKEQKTTVELSSLISQIPPKLLNARHYEIEPEFQSNFFVRNFEDFRPEDDGDLSMNEDELGEIFPRPVFRFYEKWVDQWENNFRERLVESGNYHTPIFETVNEEVAWNVTGLLLAWRILMSPHILSIVYHSSTAKKYYLLTGKETEVISQFLQDQVALLEQKHPSNP
ncbi:hypothetical protein N7462_010904 [Penicillium macrosclerotiorum]|uniref:uncharacterized protein n=1 Tax=Penicillium macrosclerotiorum TaxID=303699 RepID=UPI002546C25C|nr:uncharacterized protein N7462_010904 [Penicillium macrosclerotiorum]KAJ5669834.1 hypothetical protein N7462_010904 [Penicillium macrosclerotiorum]